MEFDITSPSNDRIKWLVRLKDRKHRDAEGVFVVEGERLYRRAIEAGLEPIQTFVSDTTLAVRGGMVLVAPEVMDKASYRSKSEGIIGVFDQPPTDLGRIELGADPLLLVLEDIEKPGNLGAMCRTANAAGADAVVTVGQSVDPWNPNALRASTGAVFSIPLAVSDWDDLSPWIETHGIEMVAADPYAETTIFEADLRGAKALVIGAEDAGLSDRATELAETLVSIPQTQGTTDSLNASVAAGVVLFEAVRQRNG